MLAELSVISPSSISDQMQSLKQRLFSCTAVHVGLYAEGTQRMFSVSLPTHCSFTNTPREKILERGACAREKQGNTISRVPCSYHAVQLVPVQLKHTGLPITSETRHKTAIRGGEDVQVPRNGPKNQGHEGRPGQLPENIIDGP